MTREDGQTASWVDTLPACRPNWWLNSCPVVKLEQLTEDGSVSNVRLARVSPATPSFDIHSTEENTVTFDHAEEPNGSAHSTRNIPVSVLDDEFYINDETNVMTRVTFVGYTTDWGLDDIKWSFDDVR